MLITLSTVTAHLFQQLKESMAEAHSVSKPTEHTEHCCQNSHHLCLVWKLMSKTPPYHLSGFLFSCNSPPQSWHAKICQLMSCDNTNSITFKQGHPSPPKKRREGGPGVGCTPLRELMLHAPTGCSCLWWCYPDWGVPCAGTGAACAGCSALHRAVFGPSVEFAWQGLIFSVRGGRAAPAVQTAGLWVPKRQRHQGYHTKSILMFCLSCAVPYTAEKMALNSEELIWTKYSKVFPRTVTVFECLSKNAFRIKRNKQHCKWQTPFLSNLKSILIYFVSNSFHSKLRRFEMTAFKLFLLQSVTPWGNTMELAFIYQAKLKAFQREQYFILCLCSI